MGSVNVSISGISVVDKYATANLSFVKHSRRIKQTASATDTQTTLQVDAVTRALGSGSIVHDGVVTYYDEVVVGMTLPGRTVNSRIASGDGAARTLSVDLADNETLAVIPTGLLPHTPQEGVKHTGNKVIVSNSVGDTTVRKDN